MHKDPNVKQRFFRSFSVNSGIGSLTVPITSCSPEEIAGRKDTANQAAAEAARRADEIIRQEMAFSATTSSAAEPNVVPQQSSIVGVASGGDGSDSGSSELASQVVGS